MSFWDLTWFSNLCMTLQHENRIQNCSDSVCWADQRINARQSLVSQIFIICSLLLSPAFLYPSQPFIASPTYVYPPHYVSTTLPTFFYPLRSLSILFKRNLFLPFPLILYLPNPSLPSAFNLYTQPTSIHHLFTSRPNMSLLVTTFL